MNFALIMLIGLLIDAAIGWPKPLYARIGHPVTWLGALITLCEARLNSGHAQTRILRGGLAMGIVVIAAIIPMLVLTSLLPDGWLGVVLGGVLAWPWIAARSLHDHVEDVARPLMAEDLDAARDAVSMIVGRSPHHLSPSGVSAAALESLSENTSDGVVAPLFWGLVAGLPGIAAYKAINTLDSMIGHRSERYEAFGKVSARVDDVVNWVPARLTGLLFAAVAGRRFSDIWEIMSREAPNHRSPNAGWPEGAMAGVLNVRLSGPRVYEGRVNDEPFLNGTAPDPVPADLRRALSHYRRSMTVLALIFCILAIA